MHTLLDLAFVLTAWQSALSPQESTPSETRFHRVYLRNGNVIEGQLIKDASNEVVLKVGFGEMAIRKDQIDRVELVKMRSLRGEPKPKAPEVKSPAPPAKAENPQTENDPSIGSPDRTPQALRDRIDGMIVRWRLLEGKSGAAGMEQLAKNLEEVGAEGVPYLCWLLSQNGGGAAGRPIAIALGTLGDRRAFAPLGRLLKSKEPESRLSGVLGLSLMGTADVQPLLLSALDDEALEVWQGASQGLLDKFRKEGGTDLIRTVVSRMDQAKAKAPYAILLGRTGHPEAHRALLDLFRDGDENGKLGALQGLALIGDPQDGDPLQRVLGSASPSIQKQICLLLGKLKYRPAVSTLIERLRQDDAGLRANAYWALKEITGQSFASDPELWAKWWETTGSKEQEKK